MKIAYFDCFAGASGDMILGALLDTGLPLETLKTELAKMGIGHYDLRLEAVVKKGLAGSQALVVVDEKHHQHHQRHLADIKSIINDSSLSDNVKQKSISIFQRIAKAEAKVHHTDIENIHFHEVGAVDAIIDVVGAVVGIEELGIEKIYCSPLHLGSGTVECAHGTLPVPAPATAELVKGYPAYSTGVVGELLTPTGAAILTTLAEDFGPMPPLSIDCIGYGAGTSDPTIPNLLRVFIGGLNDQAGYVETEQVAVIETNIDDMNPQLYDYVIEEVLKRGAMDIFLASVQMKKNRTGILLTIVCSPVSVWDFANFLLRETTTIGTRWRLENRIKASRTIQKIDTPYGKIRFKLAEIDGEVINASPEYDDCKRAALHNKVPIKKVMEELRTISVSLIPQSNTDID